MLQPLMLNGGPTGAIAGYIYVFFGVLSQVLVLGEMASMFIAYAKASASWKADTH